MNNPALDPGRSVAVSASAGSGKTHTLVSRIVRLLLAGATPGGILALTFTRKAAAEMRARVESRLAALAYADTAALDAALLQLELLPDEALRRRARGLHEAMAFSEQPPRALTLHAFCQDLLARFAVEAEVPARFSLIESEGELRREARERLFAGIRREPQGAAAEALAALIAAGESESSILALLKGLAERRADWWALTQDRPDPLAGAISAVWQRLETAPDEDASAAVNAPAFNAQLSILYRWLDQAPDRKINSLAAADFEALLDQQGHERLAALGSVLLTQAGEPRKFKPAKSQFSAAQSEALLRTHDAVMSGLMQAIELQQRQLCAQRSAAALTLGAGFLAELEAGLRRRHALGFAELEWRALRLLTNADGADWVRYKLDQQLEHLLLDEFQDTSATQWRLLLPLLQGLADETSRASTPLSTGASAPLSTGAERSRSAFVVGDAKQSIYGFRRARPELLELASVWIEQQLAGVRQPLNQSWRSAPAVIGFVNQLFAGTEGQQIGFAPHGTHRETLWGWVEVLPLIPREPRSEQSEPSTAQSAPSTERSRSASAERSRSASAERSRSTEAPPPTAASLRNPLTESIEDTDTPLAAIEGEQLAERLVELHAARLPVIAEGETLRALRWGDVMILARNRTHLGHIEAALAARGIPFVGSTKGTLLDTALLRDLCALLRALDAPHRDLELAHALRSPIFSVSDTELIQLARAARQTQSRYSLALAGLGESAPPALRRAQGLLAGWREAARQLPAHDLLDRIASEGDLARRYEAATPGDSQVRANLAALLQLALDADQGRYPSIGRFLDWLSRRSAEREAPDEPPPPAADQARVMTVHAAKGLEAPLVCLVNAAPVQRSRGQGWLLDWPAEDQRPRALLLASSRKQADRISAQLLDAEAAREQREALNLLYVAVTRARQYLLVSAFASGQNGWNWEDSWHAQCWRALAPPQTLLPEAAAPPPRRLAEGALPLAPAEPTRLASRVEADPRLRQPLPLARAAAMPPSAQGGEPGPYDRLAIRRGIGIHWLLDALSRGTAPQPQWPTRLAQLLGEKLDADEYGRWLKEAETVVRAPALAAFFAPEKIRRAWNEAPIQSSRGESALGVIDRLVDDGETLWLLDYKTHRSQDPATVLAGARAQLLSYAAAVRELWPQRRVRAGVIWTPRAEFLELPLG